MMERWRALVADNDKTCATFTSPWGHSTCFPGLVERGTVVLSELSRGVTEVVNEVKRLLFPGPEVLPPPPVTLGATSPMSFSSFSRPTEVLE